MRSGPAGRDSEGTRKTVASESFAPRLSSLQSADKRGFNQPISNLSISRSLKFQSAAMASGKIIPRLVEPRLVEALDDSPAVLIHGPRQAGKTTLAQTVGKKRGYQYFNLDDDVLRTAAEEDPMGFVGDLPDRAILDEVQRVPAVFTALKSAQGSGTVALVTASALVAPMLGQLGLDTEIGRVLTVMAIGAGSMIVSHANDSFFWVVSQFSRMSVG